MVPAEWGSSEKKIQSGSFESENKAKNLRQTKKIKQLFRPPFQSQSDI